MVLKNWKTGTGYPAAGASLDVWENEFLSRGAAGLGGRPHFKLANGAVEFFAGPAILQIEHDGSILAGPDTTRSSANRMVIQFWLDQDIAEQIERARRWLMNNQQSRFNVEKQRIRAAKYRTYLRVFDGSCDGATLDDIARILYPHIVNEYPEHSARKQVSKDISTAKKLAQRGLRLALNRK